METDYRYLTTSRSAFVAQVVQYAAKGYHYYVRCEIPPGKDPAAVDAKLLDRYAVRTKRWQRKRRNRGDAAAIHYLRYERTFVLMLTRGRHDAFYADHASSVRDIRQKLKSTSSPLKVFGYSIRSVRCPVENRRVVRVPVGAGSVPKGQRALREGGDVSQLPGPQAAGTGVFSLVLSALRSGVPAAGEGGSGGQPGTAAAWI